MTDISEPLPTGTDLLTDEQADAEFSEIVVQLRQASAEGRLRVAGVLLGVTPRDGSCELVANSFLVVDPRLTPEVLGDMVERLEEMRENLEAAAADPAALAAEGPGPRH